MIKNIIVILLLIIPFIGKSQHTFSIVAVDSITGEIGSAGATCISSEDGALYISDIILNTGAINTQTWWTTVNQNAARVRMVDGDSPAEIINWLVANDNPSQGGNINDRQYGVVDLNDGSPRSSAYTGSNNLVENGQRVGPGYSIQGNVLNSQDVLNDMEFAYLNTTGPLCDKLMAVLQAAKRPGADSRCLDFGISSASAFIRVAKPTDVNSSYGNLWLDINVWLNSGTFTGDPIDELQIQFDIFKLSLSIIENNPISIKVYPNPTTGIINLETNELKTYNIQLINILGKIIIEEEFFNSKNEMDLSHLKSGVYFIKIYDSNESRHVIKKITLHKK